MICDNCGQSEWVLTTMDIVEPDGSRTRVRICFGCKMAELPEGWRKETVFDQVAAWLKEIAR